MNRLAKLSGTKILLASVAWLVFVILLNIVGILVTARQLGRLAAIGFDITGLAIQLFAPPAALGVTWIVARRRAGDRQ